MRTIRPGTHQDTRLDKLYTHRMTPTTGRSPALQRKGVLPGRKHAFAPAVRDDTRVLVLGSLPGEASLKAAQYYAHPRNLFWHLMERVISKELVSLDYQHRLRCLNASFLGLWDVIASAERKGSLDTAIKQAETAPLTDLVTTLPNLRAVAFNGKTAAKIGMPQLQHTGLALIALPSSSPAYAAMPLTEKEHQWSHLRKYLA